MKSQASNVKDKREFVISLQGMKQEGKIEGRREGFILGREEGRMQALCDVVRRMRRAGVAPDVISEYTGLTLERIQTFDVWSSGVGRVSASHKI